MSFVPRALAFVLLPVLCVLATAQGASPSSEPPTPVPETPLNVVLVVIDDVGHDLVGTYARKYSCNECPAGSVPDPCTPNLDQLASEGVSFTNVWSTPWCTPTRAQVLTGKRPSSLGIGRVTDPTNPGFGLDPEEVTLADLFPYAAAVGKWHLADKTQGWTHPLECGFATFAGTMWNLNPTPADGPSYTDWRRYDGVNPPVYTNEYATTVTTDDAIERLGYLNTLSAPWLLYVSYHAAHVPFHCPPGVPPAPVPCATDYWSACSSGCPYGGGPCRVRAMVQALDAELGRLLAHVDRRHTAVLVLGDNGSAPHGKTPPFVRGAKGTLYQGGINVPLVARAPGVRGGQEVHEVVNVSDVFATVADLAGVELPSGIVGIDSVSLAPYLRPANQGPPASPRRYVYTETFQPNFRAVNGAPPPSYAAAFHSRAIRDERYKLIEHVDATGVTHELYELVDPSPNAPPPPHDPALTSDPHELDDLMLRQATWSPEVQLAYSRLARRLAQNHPPLPLH